MPRGTSGSAGAGVTCGVGDPNRKGSVERAIRYTQDEALEGRQFESIEEQSVQAMRAAYVAMTVLTWYLIVSLAFASLLTGVVSLLGAGWILLRYHSVVVKLPITAVPLPCVLIHRHVERRHRLPVTLKFGYLRNAHSQSARHLVCICGKFHRLQRGSL